MANLLNVLNPAFATIARADTARLEGKRVGEEREQASLLARLKQTQEAEDRAGRQQMQNATIKNLLDQIRERNEAPAETPETFSSPVEAVGPDGKLMFVRPGNRGGMQPVPDYTPPPKQAPTGAAGSYTQFTGPDGAPVFFNPQTRQSVKAPPGFQPPSTRAGLPTVEERKAAAFYKSGKFGYDALERIVKGDDPSTPEVEVSKSAKAVPGFLASVGQRVGLGAGNLMTTAQVRQMRQSGLMLSDAWLRYTSGAAVPEQEVERFAESFLPRAGDDEGTLALKSQARQVIIDAIRDGAGRALDRADDGQFAETLARIRALDPEAAALMESIRARQAGTQPTAADGLDSQIDAVLGRKP